MENAWANINSYLSEKMLTLQICSSLILVKISINC